MFLKGSLCIIVNRIRGPSGSKLPWGNILFANDAGSLPATYHRYTAVNYMCCLLMNHCLFFSFYTIFRIPLFTVVKWANLQKWFMLVICMQELPGLNFSWDTSINEVCVDLLTPSKQIPGLYLELTTACCHILTCPILTSHSVIGSM